MEPFNWNCGYCGHDQVVADPNSNLAITEIDNVHSKHGPILGFVRTIACANPDCRELTLDFALFHRKGEGRAIVYRNQKPIQKWALLPESIAKPQPDYIPEHIVENYKQACRIRDLSPNASATMSRRCLQGMIRDFWEVQGQPNLSAEINAIKRSVQPKTWRAIDAVRKLGNIGAHMEADANLILDVQPDEAQALIDLIEMLFQDWYVDRHNRDQRSDAVVGLYEQKEAQKNAAANKS